MLFRVEPSHALPMYVQLVDQIRLAAAAGRLDGGEKMPAVRELAEQLGINLQTVAKAYAELTRVGVLESRRGLGTFVAQRSARATDRHARVLLRAKLTDARRIAETAGLDREDVDALLDSIWRAEAKSWKR